MPTLAGLKVRTKRLLTKGERMLERLRTPIRPHEMRSALELLTRGGADLLFVHASLSSCGRFTAGAPDVIRGLREFCDTLIVIHLRPTGLRRCSMPRQRPQR